MWGIAWKNFIFLYFMIELCYAKNSCSPIFVRWPRVRLNLNPAVDGAFSYQACKSACVHEEDPVKAGHFQQCSAFNHKSGPNTFTHHCQIYPKDQVQHIDGYVEADDRYNFYWKYCIDSERTCAGDYAFTFLSDRYMAAQEVIRVYYSKTLENCLTECLNEKSFLCRSVSFNRTDGGCHLSMQNQLSKPALLKLNNNPNYRIDYYENNCFNIVDSFTFDYKCEKDGIRVSVDSKFPYSGALYGLYDFFTCRIQPKELTKFDYLFPYPTVSKNCSDSIRYKGNDMILEVVLSTDGVEPLYFITPDDLTYQARCPIQTNSVESTNNIEDDNIDATSLNILEKENSNKEFTDTSAQKLLKMLTETIKSQKVQLELENESSTTGFIETTTKTLKPSTKDMFTLPTDHLFTTANGVEDTTTSTIFRSSTSDLTTSQLIDFSDNSSIPTPTTIKTTSPLSTTTTTTTPPSTFSPTTISTSQNSSSKFKLDITKMLDNYRTQTSKSNDVLKPRTFQIVEEGFVNTVTINFPTKKSNATSKLVSNETTSPITKTTEESTTAQVDLSTTTTSKNQEHDDGERSDTPKSPAMRIKFRTTKESSTSVPKTRDSLTQDLKIEEKSIPDTKFSIEETHKWSISNSTTVKPSNQVRIQSNISNVTPDLGFETKVTTKRAIPFPTFSRFPGGRERDFYTQTPFVPPLTRLTAVSRVNPHSFALLTTTKPFRFSTHISFPTKGSIGVGSVKDVGEEEGKSRVVLGGHGDDPTTDDSDLLIRKPKNRRQITGLKNPNLATTTTTTQSSTTTSPSTTIKPSTSTTTTTTTTIPPTTTTPKPSTTTTTIPNTTTRISTTRTSPASPPTSTTTKTTTWHAKPPGTDAPIAPPGGIPPHLRYVNENGTLTRQPQPPGNKKHNEAIIFDIFHHGQPAEAVVVGSRITLSFTPYYAIPPAFMHISGCQVEPLSSLYEWEKEPLAIVKEGCQSDHVGLVCPPQKTDYGIRVMVEAFRYQSTTQVQYTCLIRVCPFAPCPQTTCPPVDGCPGETNNLLGPLFNLRHKRDESLEQLRARWAGTPYYQEPFALPNQPPERMSSTLRQQLMLLGGDHIVRKRLIVVNSEEELQFFVRTGEIPPNNLRRRMMF